MAFLYQYQNQNPDVTRYDDDLRKDRGFIEASKVLYKMNHSTEKKFRIDANGRRRPIRRKDISKWTDEQFADYGINYMGWFNNNLPRMTVSAAVIANQDKDKQRALLYAMQAYDDTGNSLASTGRAIKGIAADPTSWFGLTSFGITMFAGQVSKQALKAGTKKTLIELLKQGAMRGGAVAAIETGAYTGVQDVNRQVVEIAAEGDDTKSIASQVDNLRTVGEVAKGAATGFVFGTTLDTGISSIVQAFKKPVPKVKKEPTINATNKTDEAVTETPSEGVAVEKLEKEAAEVVAEGTVAKPSDAIPEVKNTTAGEVLDSLHEIVAVTKRTIPKGTYPELRPDGTQNKLALNKLTDVISNVIGRKASLHSDEIVEFITKADMTDGQLEGLKNAAQNTVGEMDKTVTELAQKLSKTTDEKVAIELNNELAEVVEAQTAAINLDTVLSSATGRSLGSRAGGANAGMLRGKGVEHFQEQGLSDEDAVTAFLDVQQRQLDVAEKSKEVVALNRQIVEAGKTNDFAKRAELRKLRDIKLDEIVQKQLDEETKGVFKNFKINETIIRPLTEVFVSNVFTVKSVAVNIVPSVFKVLTNPVINGISRNGVTANGYKAVMAEYGAMVSVSRAALRAAKQAFRYERSILTGDTSKFLEDQTVIPKTFKDLLGNTVGGKIPLGGALRFFPRVMLASDALFETVLYRGYITGKLTGEYLERGAKKGLKGKKLDEYAKNEVDSYVKSKAYKYKEEDVIDLVTDQGVQRGLTGDKLNEWVAKEMANANKNGIDQSPLANARNLEGIEYTQDSLFKFEFQKDRNIFEAAASGYESAVAKAPILRLMGQLFTRTPIRVFEAGFRLTPVVNLALTSFRNDLAGSNGTMRQVRAQGELFLTQAFMFTAFTKYATGEITGFQTKDYKQRRQLEDAGSESYTIKFGSNEYSYRNLDPFATPLKIIVNSLEQLENLQYRQSQGENVPESAFEEIFQYMQIPTISILMAVKDANLTSGISGTLDLFEDLEENDGGDAVLKFFAEKVAPVVPSTWTKMNLYFADHPVLNNPVSLEQFFLNKVDPINPKIPRRFTALGRETELKNIDSMLNPLAGMTEAELKARQTEMGMSEKEIVVQDFLSQLSKARGTSFNTPFKYNKFYPDVDLRQQYTVDGTEPIYNRWNRYLLEQTPLVKTLYVYAKQKKMAYGTPSEQTALSTAISKIFNQNRELAMQLLLRDERIALKEMGQNPNDALIQMQNKTLKSVDAKLGRLNTQN